jgi:hypothetical protein
LYDVASFSSVPSLSIAVLNAVISLSNLTFFQFQMELQ